MSFVVYDIVFMLLFILIFIIFIIKKKKNLKRQGILYLYPTKIGIEFIDRFTTKYEKFLKPLQYLIVACGYFLMVLSIGFLYLVAKVYFFVPGAAEKLKVPAITPLVPYLPELFNLTYLPSFPFTYWIIIIAIIAVPHEFAHGIFARLNKIKVKSTGFGFLGPFLAAFVEPDEKKMNKSPKFAQLSILAAGTFANILVMIISTIVMWLFFFALFTPAGVNFNTYALSPLNVSQINTIGGKVFTGNLSIASNDSLIVLVTKNNLTFYSTSSALETALSQHQDSLIVYDNSPAINARLSGAISEIDGKSIGSNDELKDAISSHKPGDKILITTRYKNGTINHFSVILGNRDGRAYLGIASMPLIAENQLTKVKLFIATFADPLTYYTNYNNVAYYSILGDFGVFIYNLFWWIILISFSVAVMNMVPVGIFDGGAFFKITIKKFTGSDKAADIAGKITLWLFLLLLFAMMAKWFIAIFL